MDELVRILKNGKIAVMPTDTIYGIVGIALSPQTVEKIYQLRKRAKDKPFIILISKLDDLNRFNVKLTSYQNEFLQDHWPNSLSVVLPVTGEKFKYLHRGKNSLAFRMPKDERLLELLKKIGPLVAPSANLAGEEPAENISEAKKYFGKEVDFYLDKGYIRSKPSTLIKFENYVVKVLRQGVYDIYADAKTAG